MSDTGDSGLGATLPVSVPGDGPDVGRAETAPTDVPLDAIPDFAELRPIDADHYVRGPELARGGMGRILRARDRRLGRTVAIKELLYSSADMRLRFEREARITARLQHPAIVNIIEAGVWPSGDPFFVMKLVTGESLEKAIARRATLDERLQLLPNVIAAVDALAYAHDKEVIHRDLKPANILVGQFGETVVIDWGLAKDLAERVPSPVESAAPLRPRSEVGASDETAIGAVMGTPAYMPREQAAGDAVDARGDVYALGAILCHLLSGAPPYPGATNQVVLEAVLAGPPAPLPASLGAPPELVAILEKAMARTPDARYHDAGELAAELRRYSAGQRVAAHHYTFGRLVRRWLARHRVLVGAAAMLALAGIAGLVFYVHAIGAEQRATRDALTQADELRAVAERSRDAATAQTMRLLEEQGRSRMAMGEPLQALAYLSKSYSMGNRSTAVRYLLARALPAASAVDLVVPAPAQARPTYFGNSAFFTPDSRRAVVYGDDGVRIFDVEDGRVVARVEGTLRPVVVPAQGQPVAVLVWPEPHEPGGPLRAANGAVTVFDLATGLPRIALAPLPPDTTLLGIAIDDDATAVAIESADGIVRVSDARTGDTRWTLPLPAPSPDLALSPTGAYLLHDLPGACAIRRASDGKLVQSIPLHGDGAQCFFAQEDDALLVVRTLDHRDGRYDVRTGHRTAFTATADIAPYARVFMRAVRGAAMSRFATFDHVAQQVVVWSGDDGRKLSGIRIDGPLDWLAYDRAQRTLAVTTRDLHLRIYDADAGLELADLSGAGTSATLSPDGRHVMARRGSTWSVWSVDALRRAFVLPTPGKAPPPALAYSPSGDRLALATPAGIAVVDPSRGATLATLPLAPPRSMSFAPDGESLATADGHRAAIVDARTGAVAYAFGDDVSTVEWAPRGDLLLAGGAHADGRGFGVWRRTVGGVAAVRDGLRASRWLPDAATLVADDGAFIDAASGAPVRHLPLAPTFTSVTADGGTLVNGAASGHVDVWNLRAQTHTSFETQSHPYLGAITPDGALVIAVDEAVRVWDAETGSLLDVLEGPPALALAMRPGGAQVATGDEAGTTRLWNIALEARPPSEIEALVRRRVPWRVDDEGRLVPTPTASP